MTLLNRKTNALLLLIATCLLGCSKSDDVETGLQPNAGTPSEMAEVDEAQLQVPSVTQVPETRQEVPAPDPTTAIVQPTTKAADFLWTDAKYPLPKGLPPSDKPQVIVRVLEPAKMEGRELGPFPVSSDGSCRLGLPKGATKAETILQSDFLYSLGNAILQLELGEVVVKEMGSPQLGTLVRIQVNAPGSIGAIQSEAVAGAGLDFDQQGSWPTHFRSEPFRKKDETYLEISPTKDGTIEIPAMTAHWRRAFGVRAPGYAWVIRNLTRDELDPGAILDLVVSLEPEHIIRVTTADSLGNPVENVNLLLLKGEKVEEKLRYSPWREVQAVEATIELRGLVAGEYAVMGSADGYLDGFAQVECVLGKPGVSDANLTMLPARGISGHVAWSDGTPFAEATVTARSYGAQNPREFQTNSRLFGDLKLLEVHSTETDAAGRFEVIGFQGPGELEVIVNGIPPHFVIPEGTKKLAARKLRRKATVVANFPNVQMGDLELRLVLGNGNSTISGQVSDDRGQALDSFRVSAFAANPNGPGGRYPSLGSTSQLAESPSLKSQFKKVGGHFTLTNLDSGSWGLLFSAKDHIDTWVSTVQSGDKNLAVTLNRPATVRGTVSSTQGIPITGGSVRLVHLETKEVFHSFLYSDDEWSFVIEDIPAGLCTIQYSGTFGPPVHPKTPTIELELKPGEVKSDVQLISSPPASIHGSIDLSWHQPPCQVTAKGLVDRYSHVDENGQYRIDGLPAGSYRVALEFDPTPTPSMGHKPGWSRLIELSPDQDLEVNLGPFDQGLQLEGQVGIEGQNLTAASVRFIALTGDRSIHETVLDPSGQFSITLPKGTSFAVLVTGNDRRWPRSPWFAIQLEFTPVEGSRVHWSMPTSRFKVICVDEAGSEVEWAERSPASDLRFLPQSIPDPTSYIAGHIRKGKVLPNVLPGSQYSVEGFVQDTTGKVWRIKADQTFIAPPAGETKEARVGLYRK